MIQYNNIDLRLGDKQIFKDFNLNISAGDKVLLNAPSGSGKSTLVKMLLGFQRPDKGQITLNDQTLDKHTCQKFRSQCSYVSQDVDLPQIPVIDLFERIYGFKANHTLSLNESRIKETFNLFDLEHAILKKNVKNLSGGERQRLGLVLCLELNRPIWLLDEVTSGLDRELKQKVFDLVVESDKTVMIISHDDIWDSNLVRKVRLD